MSKIASSNALVKINNGIVYMQFDDGSVLDFTEPKAWMGGMESGRLSCEKPNLNQRPKTLDEG